MMMPLVSQAAPSAIEDEAFLLFLADTIESDGELIDPLTMNSRDDSLLTKPIDEQKKQKLTQSTTDKAQEEDHE